ncbi:Similar to Ube2h: Ubiquitin-conjugating enzyme E2 H (Mus musculus) [Cotesia congregata]|uniref:Similar to Ube2h: Ubiquitin-conjugating enzyme E2 H (Mus musculus) n=1 Tax=Cotesia congregata TaxID=51543 RepID=A0A8J2HHH2_COTCN|nr:Similar to Ube2h: Ubiquitin-conjugating enzyme E2 H (Mus musculus) [Cotesia congregata]
MSSPSAGKRRMDTDVIKLIESKHEVTILGGLNEFSVKFYGPRGNPLNGDAAAMYLHKPDEYKKKVADYVRKYATEEALRDQENAGNGNGVSSESESSMSDFSEDEAQDMEL